MKRYAINLSLLLVAFSCLHLGCKETPPEPPQPKDPRTYTWTVDTIAYPGSFQTTMRDIWGSSPSNVYVVGHNESPGPGTMFHYNGVRWSTTGFHAVEGGSIAGPVSLSAIYGFGPNDIYAVGERINENLNPPSNFLHSSLIIHFDGQDWRELTILRGAPLQAIGGASPNDLWAGGAFGQSLYHIRNQQPELVGNDTLLMYADFAGSSSSDVYALVYQVDRFMPMDSTYYYVYRFNGNFWQRESTYLLLPGMPMPPFGTMSLWIDKGTGLTYSVGDGGVFVKGQQGWEKLVDTYYTTLMYIYGSSSANIFAVGGNRMVFHYNGRDWQELLQLESLTNSLYYSAVWTDGTETFIVGQDGTKSYVLHGK